MEHKFLGPDPKRFLDDVLAYPDLMGPVSEQEDNNVGYNEGIICVWRSARYYACSNRQQHKFSPSDKKIILLGCILMAAD
jgi:hypothetical protein